MARRARQMSDWSGEWRSGAMGKRLLGVAVVVLLIAVSGYGCSSKKKPTTAEAAAGAGMNEEGLGAGGSLGRAQAGLSPGEGGPLRDIHFAFDSYELDESARSTLRENANWLKDHAQSKAEVEGHCDERGTVEYNLALGAKRA